MKKNLVLFSVISLLLVGCASHYDEAEVLLDLREPFGFFSGVLHGFLFVFSLLGMLISWIAHTFFDALILADVRFIGKPNTGLSYGIGYFIGVIIWFIVSPKDKSTNKHSDWTGHQCRGRTKQGYRCSKRAKGNGYCGIHGGY